MRTCSVCQKGRTTGNKVSHANNKTPKTWEANLQKIRALVDGEVKRVYVCTRCIRGNKITKPPVRKRPATTPAA